MSNKSIKVSIPGVADTGSDVTITAHSKWPQGWELVPANGVISGIGAAATSMQSQRSILTKGPEVKLPQEGLLWQRHLSLCGAETMGSQTRNPFTPTGFPAGAAAEHPTSPLTWKSEGPIWVEQWPLVEVKAKALESLVQEQLRATQYHALAPGTPPSLSFANRAKTGGGS